MKTKTTILLILAVIIAGIFVFINYSNNTQPSQYFNEDIGISFNLPSESWEVTEKVFESTTEESSGHYWINAKRKGVEISFDIRKTTRVGGFVLSSSTQSLFKKATSTDNIDIWRPNKEVIKNKKELVRLRRQPQEEMISGDSKRAFRFIFPEFNQTNNVGDKFDGGSGRFVNEPFSISIIGGVDISSTRSMNSLLEDIDFIINSLSFSKPKISNFYISTSTDKGWNKYSNEDYGFLIRYPSDYNQFVNVGATENQLMEVEATSTKKVLINGGYNHYPTLSVSVYPIDSYEYETMYGLSYHYDPQNNTCYKMENGVRENYSFSISTEKWSGCKVGTGDAGWLSEGYAIPLKDKDLVVEIIKSSYYGSSRPPLFETIVKSLKAINS